MNKTKFKYVKYTKQELDRYVRDKNSCITLTNSELHVGFPPWGFASFQETLTNIISRDKIGKYDAKLNGIVLEVRNIKVFGTAYPVHDDDPYNHINIKANFYVFQPRIGATIKGVVKHISHGHVAVIIYRVFNVSIRFNRTAVQDSLGINQQISFRIKQFDLQGAMPYIEGELIQIKSKKKPENSKTHLKFEDDIENDRISGGDSGISTEENDKRTSKKQKIETDTSSGSSSSEDSDSESNENSNHGLIDGLFPNVIISAFFFLHTTISSTKNCSFSTFRYKLNKKNYLIQKKNPDQKLQQSLQAWKVTVIRMNQRKAKVPELNKRKIPDLLQRLNKRKYHQNAVAQAIVVMTNLKLSCKNLYTELRRKKIMHNQRNQPHSYHDQLKLSRSQMLREKRNSRNPLQTITMV